MASVVKVSFKGIMKRLTYGTEEANFDRLVKTLKESFSIAEGAKLRILYTDSDGDKVLLSDNEDLKDALKNQKLNPLYLEVTIIKEAKSEAKSEAKTAAGGPALDPLAALFGNMNNWTNGEGKERFNKFASSFKQGQDVFESILKDINPSTAAGSSDLMEKILAGVSAAAAAATDAASAASSSKSQEEGPKEAAKPEKAEKKAEKKADKEPEKMAEKEPEKETEKEPEKETEKKTEKEDSEEKANESVHPGVQCDVCSMIPIKGTRYKSLDQHDYDLCQACMDAYPNKTEQFTRIEHPLYRPRGFGPGFRGGRGGPRCMPPGLQFGGRPFMCGNANPSNRWGGGRHWGPPSTAEAKPDARFVKDVTIYDGTEMVPGTPFTKIWRFRNVGTTAWPQGTRIIKVGGDSLAEQETFELQISENGLAPGEEVDVAANLKAPEKPGRYVTHFRLATPQGVRFGHRMWALIHVLDKDEESPLVADSKAEDVTPSAPAVPAPEKEPVKETSDDVKVIPVEGADVTPEETAVVVTPESPTSEPTNLGDDGFMKVEQSDTKSPEDSSPEETVIQAPAPTPPAVDAPKTADTASPEKALSAAEDASAEQVVPESVVANKAPEGELYKEQLAKLAELGFGDGAQNVALLEKYGGDLPKTINDLVTVNEWDPMLQELEEMGFYDKELNRSLIYKNNGRLQRVVKDLVQIYKAGPSA
ncbi:hypothetical protein KFL_006150010 [Klebsormidium nitens]|uniref:ZZ-type domain-containing protein n=1 Tax=Klebsormidium nitens TaxID=105231 RepID=A0A1Y1IL99_KLENI|nr:hypothetical protein KFL_006150010 [Klebsormidium nitens]|eukprot:GAQ90219.1 hypothetical protein KFL_006150010 [Klebsormidium nitens]